MEIVDEVQQALANRFGTNSDDVIGPSMSPVTFVPPLPKQRQGTSSVVRRAVTNSRLEASYDALLDSGYLAIDPVDGGELWRISVRVAAFKDVDYGRFVNDLRGVVDPIVAKYVGQASNLPDDTQAGSLRHEKLSAVYTGVVPIVYKAQRALLDSLIESTFWSFVTITPLLMLVSGGVGAGIVAMLPNVLPVLVVLVQAFGTTEKLRWMRVMLPSRPLTDTVTGPESGQPSPRFRTALSSARSASNVKPALASLFAPQARSQIEEDKRRVMTP